MLLHLTSLATAAAAGDSAPVSASIAVTAITTIGVVLVALITSFRRRDTGSPTAQVKQTEQQNQLSGGGSVHAEDSRQNERLAVLEYQQKDSRDRIRALERRAGVSVSPENEENQI